MSKKRFVCIDVGYGDDWYITDNGERLSEMEIVDCLNEQQAELEQLERKLELKTEEIEYLKRMMVKWGMVKDE